MGRGRTRSDVVRGTRHRVRAPGHRRRDSADARAHGHRHARVGRRVDVAGMRAQAMADRVLPTTSTSSLESLLARMIRLLLIEISAFHAFAWAEELLGDPDLVAGDGEAATLVSYIRADETPHVDVPATGPVGDARPHVHRLRRAGAIAGIDIIGRIGTARSTGRSAPGGTKAWRPRGARSPTRSTVAPIATTCSSSSTRSARATPVTGWHLGDGRRRSGLTVLVTTLVPTDATDFRNQNRWGPAHRRRCTSVRPMKFGIAFANAGPMSEPTSPMPSAPCRGGRRVRVALDGRARPGPRGYESEYPYDPSGKMPGGETIDFPDPLIWMAFVAAGDLDHQARHRASSSSRSATRPSSPRRSPPSPSSRGGRMLLGVGAGWLEEEFDALGIPFNDRGRRLDSYIATMRALGPMTRRPWTTSSPRSSTAWPAQAARAGSVPIVIGGHSEPAARRAGRIGDGFFPGRGSHEDLAHLLDVMRVGRRAGRPGSRHDRDQRQRQRTCSDLTRSVRSSG